MAARSSPSPDVEANKQAEPEEQEREVILRGNGSGQPLWEQKLRRLLAEGKAGKVRVIQLPKQ